MGRIIDVMIDKLQKDGMSITDANKVMMLVQVEMNEKRITPVNLGNDSYSYPKITLNLLYQLVKKVALDYIVKNCPEAWFRPMFDPVMYEAAVKEMEAKATSKPNTMDKEVIHKLGQKQGSNIKDFLDEDCSMYDGADLLHFSEKLGKDIEWIVNNGKNIKPEIKEGILSGISTIDDFC